MTNDEIKEQAEHQLVLRDIQAVIALKEGKNFIKYLFNSLGVCDMPELGLPESFLRDHLGFLRAGNSIFKIVSEASPEIAGLLLAQLEKEKNVKKYSI